MNAEQETETPHPHAVGRLNSTSAVRRELARLYRDLRNGEVSSKVAGTGAYVLTAIMKTIEVEIIEKRIEALEDSAGFGNERQDRRARAYQ